MATACKIGIVKENGSVDCIVCWYDGYPDHAQHILENYYYTFEKAEELIAGGQLYELGKTVKECRYQSSDGRVEAKKCKPINYKTETAFYRADHGQCYTYHFKSGSWKAQSDY